MYSKEQLSKMSDKELVILLQHITTAFNKVRVIISDIVEIQRERYPVNHVENRRYFN